MSRGITECTVSWDILRKLAEIERYIGKVEGVQLSRPVPKLRAKNRGFRFPNTVRIRYKLSNHWKKKGAGIACF